MAYRLTADETSATIFDSPAACSQALASYLASGHDIRGVAFQHAQPFASDPQDKGWRVTISPPNGGFAHFLTHAPALDREAVQTEFREAVLKALDAAAANVFGEIAQAGWDARGEGATDAELPDLFKALDAHMRKIANRAGVELTEGD